MPGRSDEETDKLAAELIESGSEFAGAAAGGALGLIGGPPGVLAGAAGGVAVTRALKRVGAELQLRWLGPRQHERIGAAYAVACERIRQRAADDESPRSDGFFTGERPAAEELLEGVLQAAGESYEERKVRFLGNLYASIAFDSRVGRAYANDLIRLADRLTFRQLVCVAILAEADLGPIVTRLARTDPQGTAVFGEELGIELDELSALGLVGVGVPGGEVLPPGSETFPGTTRPIQFRSVDVGSAAVTRHGRRLYELMELGGIEPADREDVLNAIATIRRSG